MFKNIYIAVYNHARIRGGGRRRQGGHLPLSDFKSGPMDRCPELRFASTATFEF